VLDINSTDINGARMLGIIADILDNNSNSTDVRVKLATIQLRNVMGMVYLSHHHMMKTVLSAKVSDYND